MGVRHESTEPSKRHASAAVGGSERWISYAEIMNATRQRLATCEAEAAEAENEGDTALCPRMSHPATTMFALKGGKLSAAWRLQFSR